MGTNAADIFSLPPSSDRLAPVRVRVVRRAPGEVPFKPGGERTWMEQLEPRQAFAGSVPEGPAEEIEGNATPAAVPPVRKTDAWRAAAGDGAMALMEHDGDGRCDTPATVAAAGSAAACTPYRFATQPVALSDARGVMSFGWQSPSPWANQNGPICRLREDEAACRGAVTTTALRSPAPATPSPLDAA